MILGILDPGNRGKSKFVQDFVKSSKSSYKFILPADSIPNNLSTIIIRGITRGS